MSSELSYRFASEELPHPCLTHLADLQLRNYRLPFSRDIWLVPILPFLTDVRVVFISLSNLWWRYTLQEVAAYSIEIDT